MITNLPDSVDLRPFAGNIDNQLNLSSCIANRDTSAMEILLCRAGVKTELSRLFHYYNLRTLRNEQDRDNGGNGSISWQALKEYGTCEEIVWPYDVSRVNIKPDQNAYNHAAYKITDCINIEGGCAEPQLIEGMKAWLAKGFPILICAKVHPNFGSCTGTTLEDTRQWILNNCMSRTNREGSHAMLIVGYTPDGWIVENSWGSGWGCGGYFLAPPDWLWAYNDGYFQVITGLNGIKLTDLWTPQYDTPPKPAPKPVIPKASDKAGRLAWCVINNIKHTFLCATRQRVLGKKCSCGVLSK